MRVAIKNFTDFRYGIVAGPVFTIIFASLNLFSGALADKLSRKNLISIAAICWSLTSVGTAFTHTFAMVCFYRAMLGVFEAFCGPISYSLIVDFFPPENRTIANSFYSIGIFAGAGLASTTVLIISLIGWRGAYIFVASFGILAGFSSFLFIKEPIRGRFEIQKAAPPKSEVQTAEDTAIPKPPSLFRRYGEGFLALIRCRGTLWILIGGCCRFWQGYTLSYFSIKYFNGTFDDPKLFGTINAIAVLVGGFTSNIVGGYISDKYDNVNYRTKSYVGMWMSLLGAPVSAVCFLTSFSFWFSMTMLFLVYIVCEGWMAPNMSMIQTMIETKYKAVSIGVFLFFTTISGTICTVTLGALIDTYAEHDMKTLGYILAASASIPCLVAAFCFYMAGFHYAEFKSKATEEKAAALDHVESLKVDWRTLSTVSLEVYSIKATQKKDKIYIRQPSASVGIKAKPRSFGAGGMTKNMDTVKEDLDNEDDPSYSRANINKSDCKASTFEE